MPPPQHNTHCLTNLPLVPPVYVSCTGCTYYDGNFHSKLTHSRCKDCHFWVAILGPKSSALKNIPAERLLDNTLEHFDTNTAVFRLKIPPLLPITLHRPSMMQKHVSCILLCGLWCTHRLVCPAASFCLPDLHAVKLVHIVLTQHGCPPTSTAGRWCGRPPPPSIALPPLPGGSQDKPMRMHTGFEDSRQQWKPDPPSNTMHIKPTRMSTRGCSQPWVWNIECERKLSPHAPFFDSNRAEDIADVEMRCILSLCSPSPAPPSSISSSVTLSAQDRCP
ncbi:hypothetical protein B0H16DRAFT_1855468 [Mycena metata]|uniref:Uncharacterized protein n=1 Tax=Mycena metata TaxID=1033252 RepID=A0AAD7ILQ9_9AGAR|nr:hypothetical protein B0H16DRAFT_1855468 [Mycena metata]